MIERGARFSVRSAILAQHPTQRQCHDANNTLIVQANMGDMATLMTSAMTMLDRTKAAQAKQA